MPRATSASGRGAACDATKTYARARRARVVISYAPNRAREDEPEGQGGPLSVGGFGAYHPGVAVIGMADGATRAISYTIDKQILHGLGSRAGGELPADGW